MEERNGGQANVRVGPTDSQGPLGLFLPATSNLVVSSRNSPFPHLQGGGRGRPQVLQNALASAAAAQIAPGSLFCTWVRPAPPSIAVSQYHYMHIIPPPPPAHTRHRNGTSSERVAHLEPFSSARPASSFFDPLLFRFFIRP